MDAAETTAAMRRGQCGPAESVRPVVQFVEVSRRFGAVAAVDRLSLDIRPGEFFALLGPSGCGKTTLLRLLAGFETPDQGRILLDGTDVRAVPAYRRPVNMMFQNYALFPHLTVAGNIAFGLKQERLPQAEIAQRVADMMALLQLDGLGERRPNQLSGGQRQRVALARALVKRPRVLLLDEPLAALDKKLRERTQTELMQLQSRLGITFVIVTHDQEEAMTVADRIGLMHRGRLVQVGSPAEIYERPNSRWAADFLGEVNLIEARVTGCDAQHCRIEAAEGLRFDVAAPPEVSAGDQVWVALRPEKIALAPATAGDNGTCGEVQDIGYRGDRSVYRVRLDSGLAIKAVAVNSARSVVRHDRVRLSWPADAAVVLTR